MSVKHSMFNTTKRDYFITELVLGFLMINGLHFLIKNYDSSFDGIWDYSRRGVYFHVFFVVVGAFFWRLGLWLANKIKSLAFAKLNRWMRTILGAVLFAAYGVVVAISFGRIYYELFYRLTKQELMWKDYKIFDPDFSLIILIFYFFIAAVINLVYYFRNWKEAELTAERLKKENIQSKFEVLKNQIDPHFFFNSLSVLTSLVYKDPNLSAEYITQLSKMYRYILEGKNQSLASVGDELKFLKSYIFLINVRYNENIRFEVELKHDLKNSVYLPKNSLQMLVENAIKHNRFDDENPLVVNVYAEEDCITVKNNKSKRDLIESSSKIGLENIKKRYELIGNHELQVVETDETFTVKLPKLSQSEAGYFDI